MDSNKSDILEEKNISQQGAYCAADSDKCSICLAPKSPGSPSIHCHDCLEKMNAVPTGFAFVIAGPEKKEFECPICLSLIKDAIELPCEHLMCNSCLLHYEKQQRDKANRDGKKKKPEFLCSICQKSYQTEEKNPVKAIDRIIQTSIPVKCLQNQCDWIGCIMDYQDHQKKCVYLHLVACEYFELGCKTKVERRFLEKHNQEFKTAHESLLLEIIKDFSKEKQELRAKIEEQNKQIKNLQKTVKENSNRFEEMDIKDRKNQVRGKTTREENECKIEILQKENSNLQEVIDELKKIFKEQMDKTLMDIENYDLSRIHEFASITSKFHLHSAQNLIHECNHWEAESKENCKMNEKKKVWQDLLESMDKSENIKDCVYLQEMKNAILNYTEIIHPQKWKNRYKQMLQSIEVGTIIRGYLKISTHPFVSVENISIKTYQNRKSFYEETNQEKWYKQSQFVSTNIGYTIKQPGPHLQIAVHLSEEYEKVWILHVWDGEINKNIPKNGGIVKLKPDYLQHGYLLLKFEKSIFNPIL